jgi:hypothetical protein
MRPTLFLLPFLVALSAQAKTTTTTIPTIEPGVSESLGDRLSRS